MYNNLKEINDGVSDQWKEKRVCVCVCVCENEITIVLPGLNALIIHYFSSYHYKVVVINSVTFCNSLIKLSIIQETLIKYNAENILYNVI